MKKLLALSLCAAAMLAACGGDDDSPAPAPTPAPTAQVPPDASMTVTGLITYLQALIVADADTLEPVDVSAVTPPTNDTVEPTSVD